MTKGLVLALVVAAVGVNEAQQSARPNVRTLTIHSGALEGNGLGDPADRQVAVYLPPDYETSARRYPTVYLLHGIGDSYEVWTKLWELPTKLDRLVAEGRIPPLIVVMPDARNRFLGGYYVNSQVSGRWQDYIADDVVRLVDSTFRTMNHPDSRAVVGHSMGGFGAINLGMRRPDVFRVVYAMSPCCLDMVEDIGYGNDEAYREFLSFKTYADADLALQRGHFYPVALLGLLSAFMPNLDAPLKVDVPVKQQGNQLVPVHPAFERFRGAFPVRTVPGYAENLRQLRMLRIDYGFDDQYAHIPVATPTFSRVLLDNRVPHVLDAYDGDHRNEVANRLQTIILPAVSSMLAVQ